MRNLPIFWHEGMFLRPQHFQAADRYWSELAEVSQQFDHPYYYGLRSASFSEEAVKNNQFQLNSCRARMKDGTLINLEVGQEPDRLDMREGLSGKLIDTIGLSEAFEHESRVRVFLAVPRLKLGRSNVGRGATDFDCRYLPATNKVQDETEGGNDEELDFLMLNTRLLLATQSHAGYEVLPIAQVKRTGGADSAPEIDAEYIPPLVAMEAWPRLSREIIRAIYDRLGESINVLSEQVTKLDDALASDDPLDMRRVLGLSRVNEVFAAISSLTFAIGVHPFTAYTELCRAIGQLAIFGEARRPPEFPRYDHDNIYPVFKWFKDQIEELLRHIVDVEPGAVRRFFVGSGKGLKVTLDAQWLAQGWNWYIGVNRGIIPENECRELLKPGVMNLDWKFGSANMVDHYYERFQRGLVLEEVTQTPRNLPSGTWLYYAVRRDNEAWPHVQREQTLAMRLNANMIRNQDALKEGGKRDLVVALRGQNVVLQFALFAVAPRR